MGLPPRVSIDRPYQEVRVSLRDSCYNEYVSADLYGPAGLEALFTWDPASNGAVDYGDVDAEFTVPGVYRARDIDPFPTHAGVETSSVVELGPKAAPPVRRSAGPAPVST